MEQIYEYGVLSIQFVQEWFQDYEGYFEKINEVSNPQYLLDNLFPIVSVLDSVFAAQLLIVLAFGGWTNTLMKWCFLEDRPYWWVHETSHYSSVKPHLLQTNQTCMTSPGSPSGHTTTAASVLMLIVMWISHISNDRKWHAWSWKPIVYPLFAFALGSVILARMYVAAQFPHQCLLGAILGLFLSPALCIYLTDPFLWQYGRYASQSGLTVLKWHSSAALLSILFSVATYYSLILGGVDPHYTQKLACRWCDNGRKIDISTTPVFSLLTWTANMLAWTVGVVPELTKYRYNTSRRFLSIAIFLSCFTVVTLKRIEDSVVKNDSITYYMLHFFFNCFRPGFFLRTIPAISLWPHSFFKYFDEDDDNDGDDVDDDVDDDDDELPILN